MQKGTVQQSAVQNGTVQKVTAQNGTMLKDGVLCTLVQEAERRYLDPEPSVEMLCAIVNNNVRCYNESMEFAERLEDTLDDEHKVTIHFLINEQVT